MDHENVCLTSTCPRDIKEMNVVLGESHDWRIIRSREARVFDALPTNRICLGSGQLPKVSLVEDALG